MYDVFNYYVPVIGAGFIAAVFFDLVAFGIFKAFKLLSI